MPRTIGALSKSVRPLRVLRARIPPPPPTYFMKITIVASIQFSIEMLHVRNELTKLGHTVFIPLSTEKIANGKLTLEEYMQEKDAHGDLKFREEGPDLIKNHYKKILDSDAILVLNFEKKNIPNYIGGNGLMELGFAHVNDKKISLLNDIPNMSYTDEIQSMHPRVISGDVTKIQ